MWLSLSAAARCRCCSVCFLLVIFPFPLIRSRYACISPTYSTIHYQLIYRHTTSRYARSLKPHRGYGGYGTNAV
uniref:Putative secreted peptide n=1 Tax=Anopheles braziliensis TaxID=58242 RepID=A0A2M3ZQU0_9DIPT